MRKSLRWGAAVVLPAIVLLGLSTPGQGITFFGEDVANGMLPVPNAAAAQAAFLANLVGVGTEDFEGIPAGTQFPINVTFGADTATLSGTNTQPTTGILSGPFAGRFPISGDQYLNVGTTDAASFQLTFSSPQAAFGFFATDAGDLAGQLAVRLDGGPPIPIPHTPNAPGGNALFWGIIDTGNPFSTVNFVNTAGVLDDAFGFDDFTIGRVEQVQIIPEPMTMIGLGVGLGALAGYLRRRRI